MKCGIYTIRNTTSNRCYIGGSAEVEARLIRHQKDLRSGRHTNRPLQIAWDQFGPTEFVFEVVEVVEDPALLLEREQAWLDRVENKYNLCPVAGSRRGYKCPPETIARMKAASQGKRPSRRTVLLGAAAAAKKLRGTTRPPEIKQRISNTKRGHATTVETREKIRRANQLPLPQSVLNRLGTCEDYRLALEAGVSKNTIMRRRRQLGIASYGPTRQPSPTD